MPAASIYVGEMCSICRLFHVKDLPNESSQWERCVHSSTIIMNMTICMTYPLWKLTTNYLLWSLYSTHYLRIPSVYTYTYFTVISVPPLTNPIVISVPVKRTFLKYPTAWCVLHRCHTPGSVHQCSAPRDYPPAPCKAALVSQYPACRHQHDVVTRCNTMWYWYDTHDTRMGYMMWDWLHDTGLHNDTRLHDVRLGCIMWTSYMTRNWVTWHKTGLDDMASSYNMAWHWVTQCNWSHLKCPDIDLLVFYCVHTHLVQGYYRCYCRKGPYKAWYNRMWIIIVHSGSTCTHTCLSHRSFIPRDWVHFQHFATPQGDIFL